MPMPSLFRYFVVVGSALFGLLLFVNYLVGPVSEPAAAAKPEKLVVEHDPRASLIERLRDEEAARKAAERGEPAVAATAAPEPVPSAPEPAQRQIAEAEPPQVVAPAALHTAPAAEPVPEADTAKAEKLKAAQARKARIARERARARRQEEAASRRQDQFFYGHGQPRPAYAEAPTFDPFGFMRAR
jgi:type IV secretory pathway VirB10-like protein